jgi:hypothetical protein
LAEISYTADSDVTSHSNAIAALDVDIAKPAETIVTTSRVTSWRSKLDILIR